jgi:nucleotide-binding universal stress UspA family protein
MTENTSEHHRRRIVVGVDGSESSKDALKWAAQQAELTGASLEAAISWDIALSSYGYPVPVPSDYNPAENAEQALAETVRDVLGDGAKAVVMRTVQGNAAQTLVELAKGADLLVVGSRGHGQFVGILLGSVSEYCAAHAPCPVVVIRHHDGH